MIDVVRLDETGGPKMLKLDRVAPQQPGPGEVWLEQQAIGVTSTSPSVTALCQFRCQTGLVSKARAMPSHPFACQV
ncbi:hypothetical protein [Novosphingobium sp. 11B]